MRVNRKVKLNVDRRGKIKCGYRGNDGLPKKAYHFVIAHPETGETNFPELVEIYGTEPTSIFLAFPSNNIEDFFNDDFGLWQKNNTKRRSCNGEECTHIVDETIEGVKYSAGSVTECVCIKHGLFNALNKELKNIACKCDLYLKAWILHPETLRPISPTCYLFENHSTNSADNIYGEFFTPEGERKWAQVMNIPFVLTVKKIKKADNTTFPILNLYPYIPSDRLIDYSKAMALDVQGSKSLPVSTESTETDNEEIENAEYTAENINQDPDATQPEPDKMDSEVKSKYLFKFNLLWAETSEPFRKGIIKQFGEPLDITSKDIATKLIKKLEAGISTNKLEEIQEKFNKQFSGKK